MHRRIDSKRQLVGTNRIVGGRVLKLDQKPIKAKTLGHLYILGFSISYSHIGRVFNEAFCGLDGIGSLRGRPSYMPGWGRTFDAIEIQNCWDIYKYT